MQAPILSVPIVLGIDPGTTTGLAGYVPAENRLAFVGSASPLAVLKRIERWAVEGLLLGAYVEDARALPVYARHRSKGRGERDRVARSVGRVDLLTDLYLACLEAHGIPTQPVQPVRSKKWDAEALRRVTGYEGRTNEHGRDAARIVHGRRPPRPTSTERGGMPLAATA
jgi:hypothetical protein